MLCQKVSLVLPEQKQVHSLKWIFARLDHRFQKVGICYSECFIKITLKHKFTCQPRNTKRKWFEGHNSFIFIIWWCKSSQRWETYYLNIMLLFKKWHKRWLEILCQIFQQIPTVYQRLKQRNSDHKHKG